jgi:hypothetical protein
LEIAFAQITAAQDIHDVAKSVRQLTHLARQPLCSSRMVPFDYTIS